MKTAHLSNWSGSAIAKECHSDWLAYRAARTQSYRDYFAANPDLKADDHEYVAKDLKSALPRDHEDLAELLPKEERHRWHLSGNSSQVLALGLLGVATQRDPSLTWLFDSLSHGWKPVDTRPKLQFEHVVEPELLGEQPRQTSIDARVDDASALVCIEAKWTEEGMGKCGCAKPAEADCADKVLARQSYWDTASDIFGLPERERGKPCPLSFTYQAVRNVAAALSLAGEGRTAVFGLIYDENNPYFAGAGTWPGWPAALQDTLEGAHRNLRFRSTSWQHLMRHADLDDVTREWAREKHGL